MQYIYAFSGIVPIIIPLGVMFAGILVFVFMRARFYGIVKYWRKREPNELPPDKRESVSVVLYCHNEGKALETNLPALLSQEGVNFEVIVIDDCSDDSTADVLKRFKTKYPYVHRTFVPKSARYVGHEKLAVTLGVKAAKYEWIVLTHADCAPCGNHWLATMNRYFTEDNDVVLGYSNFADNKSVTTRRAIFERLMYHLLWFNTARKHAIGGDGANLAFRRSVFLKNNGYAAILDFTCGTDDLLVNELSSPDRTAVCCSDKATVRQYCSMTAHDYRKWKLQRIMAQQKISFKKKLPLVGNDIINLGQYLLAIGGIVAAIMLFAIHNYVAACAVCAVLIAAVIADILLFGNVTKALGEPRYVFSIPYYETLRPLLFPFWKIKCRIHTKDFDRKI